MSGDEKVNPEEIAKEMASNPELTEALTETSGDSSGDSSGGDDSKPGEKKGLMSFVKANPVPVVLGAGLLAFGIYRMMSPPKSKPKSTQLSGPTTKARRYKSRQPGRSTKKLPVKSVRLL